MCCVTAGSDTAYRKAVATHSVANRAVKKKKLVSNAVTVVERNKRTAPNGKFGPIMNSARRLSSSLFANRGRSRANLLRDADGGRGSCGRRL